MVVLLRHLQATLHSKISREMGGVGRPVIPEPLYRVENLRAPKACFCGLCHQVAHILANQRPVDSYPRHRFSIAAVQAKRHEHFLTVEASWLEHRSSRPHRPGSAATRGTAGTRDTTGARERPQARTQNFGHSPGTSTDASPSNARTFPKDAPAPAHRGSPAIPASSFWHAG